MKLVALEVSADENYKTEYSVQDISVAELGLPSKRFQEAVDKIESLKSINAFTLDQLKIQIEKQFSSK